MAPGGGGGGASKEAEVTTTNKRIKNMRIDFSINSNNFLNDKRLGNFR